MFNPRFRSALGKALVLCLCAFYSFSPVATVFAQKTSKSATTSAGKSAPASTTKAPSRAVQQAADSSQAVTGSPWTGNVGTQETTSQIMTRESATRRLTIEPEFAEIEKIQPNRQALRQNPSSENSSQFPALQRPSTPSEPLAPQTPGTSFTAATLADANAFPPDSMGAVGPTQYLLCINGRIRVFDKTTGTLGSLNTSTNTFFQSVRNGSGTSDPRVRFDRLSNRWFVLIITVSTPNRVLLAVSDTATITATTVWTFFFFQQNLVSPPGDNNCLSDYPTLGIDANALYIGVNQFCGSPLTYNGTAAFVVRKSSVLSSGPIVVTAFRNLTGTPSGPGLYTPQGVDNYDPTATEGYFVGVDNASFGTLVVRRVIDPGGTPSLSANSFLTVPATAFPLTVRHQGNLNGTNGQLDGLDDRLFAAHLRNGRLWTAQNIGVDNTGVANGGTRTRNAARWYEISNLNNPAPTLVQAGTLYTSTITNTFDERNYWIPSVMVSGQGHMALGSSIAGTAEFANAATAGRLASDPLGTLQAPVALTNSSTAYNPPSDPGDSGGRRWGDYSYTSLDPCDDMTMWTVQEFCDATNSYGVRVVKLLAPPPATPTSANPPTVPQNVSSFNVTITGTQVAGSGFFDPGNGFGCHIGATVSGGVTVNSITYQNPTTVVLNISTVGTPTGTKNVTITNPDGQSITTNNLINVGSSTCTYSINPTNQSFNGNGGTGSVAVTATDGCGWTAVSSVPWVTITSGSSGTGNGTVNYTVAQNSTGSPRSGTMTIAGQTFTVNQSAAGCDYAIAPTSDAYEVTGGSGSINVTTASGCAWTAVSNDSWITVTSGASGNGNGTVSYIVASSSDRNDRTGTITVAGQTFTVTQYSPPCVTSISPLGFSYESGGGQGSISVVAPSNCSWTSASNVGWITVTSGTSGTGNGKVKYNVAPNTGQVTRSGVVVIGKRVHRVTQAPGAVICTYQISPTNQNFGINGGSGSVNVTTPNTCNWTAVSNASWITITSGSSGSGNGTVAYQVAANSSIPRSGTLTIAGQTFTVTQDGSGGGTCNYALFPSSVSIAAAGGTGNFTVSTSVGCNWTAVPNLGWITITSGAAGSGPGTVGYQVDANTSATPRTGMITVADQQFTVTQDGFTSCGFTVTPTFLSFTGTGGTATIQVFTAPNCSWTASSPVNWVTITSGASGTGNGSVGIAVAPNPTGTTRQTTLTIAGTSVTIKQSR